MGWRKKWEKWIEREREMCTTKNRKNPNRKNDACQKETK